jgi:hypothetical protein
MLLHLAPALALSPGRFLLRFWPAIGQCRQNETLVVVHELVEAVLCKEAGVSQREVDEFDMSFERHRKPGDLSEPGDDPKAPYQHQAASWFEKALAEKLGVDWAAYSREVGSPRRLLPRPRHRRAARLRQHSP